MSVRQHNDIANATARDELGRLLRAVSDAPVVVWSMDPHGVVRLAEGGKLGDLGLQPGEPVGSAFDHVRDRPELLQDVERALGGETFSARYDVRGKTWETHYRPRLDSAGTLQEVVAVTVDVSARVEAEQALRASEDRFRIHFQNLPTPAYLWEQRDDDFILTDYNQAAVAITQGGVERVVGVRASQMYADEPEIVEDLRRCALGQTPIHREMRYSFRTTNAVRDLAVSYLFVPPAYVVVHTEDITARNETERALRVEKAHFEELFEAAPDAVALVDNESRILRVNHYFTKLFEYEATEIVGQSIDELLAPEHLRAEAPAATGRAARGERVTLDTERRKKDGTLVPVSVVGAPVTIDGGQIAVLAIYRDITEQKRVEHELRLLSSVVVNASDAVMVSQAEPDSAVGLRISYVNDAFTRLLGYTREEAIGRDLTMLHGEKTDRTTVQRLVQVMERGGRGREELLNYRKNGSPVWVEVDLFPVIEGEGRPVRWVSLGRDITARRAAEQALRESEVKFRSLFEESRDAIILTSRNGLVVDANRAALELFGYTRGEMAALHASRLYANPADRRRFRQQIEREGSLRDYDVRYRKKSGIEMDCLQTATCRRDRHGRVIGYQSIIRDITARKLMEWALTENFERFRQLAENIDSVFWLTELATRRVVYVNPAYERVWGRQVDELYESAASWLEGVHPEDRGRVRVALLPIRDDGRLDEAFRVVRPDGEVRWVHARAFPVRNERGEIYRVAGIADDITEQRRVQQELLDVSAREQRRIGYVLHDHLGQQLTGVAFLSKALGRKLAARSSAEAADADEIGHLVNEAMAQTRDLAKMLHPFALETGGLVHALEEFAVRVHRLYGVSCRVKALGELDLRDETATQLYYIVQEAVTNALRHGDSRNVEITLARRRAGTVVGIRSDGVTFPETVEPGEGMGLRIMQFRALAVGGTVSIGPARGGGTTVVCHVPGDGVRNVG